VREVREVADTLGVAIPALRLSEAFDSGLIENACVNRLTHTTSEVRRRPSQHPPILGVVHWEKVFAPVEKLPDSQPINFVDGTEPPALLLHGLSDDTVWPRNSERLAAKIRAKGGKATEHYYEDMTHSGILGALSVYFRSRRTVLDDVAAFIDQ
jgi:dipeptidyl aminopeptidase/acylaminoacyl peptidase